MLRKGHTSRIHDFGPFTVSCVSSWTSDGSHRWPIVDVIFRDRWTRDNGHGGKATIYRRVHFPLPYVKWSTAYKFRFLRPLNQGFNRLYRWAFITTYRRQAER